jgi:hypothetical protein
MDNNRERTRFVIAGRIHGPATGWNSDGTSLFIEDQRCPIAVVWRNSQSLSMIVTLA